MARSIDTIKAEMIAAKTADTTLNAALTSTSNVAIWRLWINLVAIAIYTLEVIFDKHKEEVQALAAISEYGSSPWYGQKALEFQYGDSLVIVNGVPTYAVIDETKRVVKRASVNNGLTGGLLIKVAKEASGELTSLTTAEKTAFTYYLNKIKFAGIYTSVISLPADLLKGTITIYHNGQRDITELEADLNAAVISFIKSIDFDGRLVVIKLIDILQSVNGVTDVVVNTLMSREPGDIYLDIVRQVNPASGYFKLDAGAGGITWTLIAE